MACCLLAAVSSGHAHCSTQATSFPCARSGGQATKPATVDRVSGSWVMPQKMRPVYSIPPQRNRCQPPIGLASALVRNPASRIVVGFDELAWLPMPAVNSTATVAILLAATRESATQTESSENRCSYSNYNGDAGCSHDMTPSDPNSSTCAPMRRHRSGGPVRKSAARPACRLFLLPFWSGH